jgi:hypothetical protein
MRESRTSLPVGLNIRPLARSMYVRNVPWLVALPLADGHHPFLRNGWRLLRACAGPTTP